MTSIHNEAGVCIDFEYVIDKEKYLCVYIYIFINIFIYINIYINILYIYIQGAEKMLSGSFECVPEKFSFEIGAQSNVWRIYKIAWRTLNTQRERAEFGPMERSKQ